MSRTRKHGPCRTETTVGSLAPVTPPGEGGWEQRALSRVRPRVRRLAAARDEGSTGWETDTLTRLERYFERDEV